MSPVALFSAMHEAHAVCSWHGGPREPPAPGLPCALFQFRGRSDQAKLGRHAPRGCDPMSIIHRRSRAPDAAQHGDALQSLPMHQRVPWPAGSRLCAAAQERCSASRTRERRAQSLHTPSASSRTPAHEKRRGYDPAVRSHPHRGRVDVTFRCRTRSAIGPPAAARWRRGRSPPSPSGDGCCGACRASGRRSTPASRC